MDWMSCSPKVSKGEKGYSKERRILKGRQVFESGDMYRSEWRACESPTRYWEETQVSVAVGTSRGGGYRRREAGIGGGSGYQRRQAGIGGAQQVYST